jgi:hypothetical protein
LGPDHTPEDGIWVLALAKAVQGYLAALGATRGGGDPSQQAVTCDEAVVVVTRADRLAAGGLAAVLRALQEARRGPSANSQQQPPLLGSGEESRGSWGVAQVLGVDVPAPPTATFVLLVDSDTEGRHPRRPLSPAGSAAGSAGVAGGHPSSTLAAQEDLRAALPEPLR